MRRFRLAAAFAAMALTHAAVIVGQTAGPLVAPDCATKDVASAKRAPSRHPAGTPDVGKTVWALGNTSCRNCHGADAEGAYGPTLAGRKLPFDLVRTQIRKPCGIMPAFIPTQLTDQEIADLVAYWDSLPLPKTAAAWRTALPAAAPKGQELAVQTVGCAQCHGATLDTPRHGLAEINGDWEWFKRQVYSHQTAIREHWRQLDHTLPQVTPGPAGPPGRDRVRMGHYDRARLPEPVLRQIFDWAVDLGYLPPLTAQLTLTPSATGKPTYTIDLVNAGIRMKGLAAQDVSVSVAVPANAAIVTATGMGYQGMQAIDNTTRLAVWRLPRLESAQREKLTLTLSAAAPDLRGTIRWAKPAVKADNVVIFRLSNGGRGAQAVN